MDDRIYILLDIVDDKAKQAVQVLQGSPGVAMADVVEGPPDVIIVMEAAERQQLAKLVTQAIASVETMTEHVCLLPTRDILNTATFPKLSRRSRTNGKTES
jgi:hypothetical protein